MTITRLALHRPRFQGADCRYRSWLLGVAAIACCQVFVTTAAHATHDPSASEPIVYDGTLAAGVSASGAIGFSNPVDHYDWWSFLVTAGQPITIQATRTSGDILLNIGLLRGIAEAGATKSALGSALADTANSSTPGVTFTYTPSFSGPVTAWVSTWTGQAGGDYSLLMNGGQACGVCGDGVIGACEQCDDGDLVSGNGCSSHCLTEPCFTCTGSPSVCTQPDADADGLCDVSDNCPTVANPGQTDGDHDGIGDACDACVGPGTTDSDTDGFCDSVDTCPTVANASQADTDRDGIGDACNDANDADGDEWADTRDNCPAIANASQSDCDGDGTGDACDADATDLDGDGVAGVCDNCPGVSNPAQQDSDSFLVALPGASKDTIEAGVDIHPASSTGIGALTGTNIEFSCGTCVSATFTDAVTQIGAGSGICGYSNTVMRLLLANDNKLCVRSKLSGRRYEIDLRSHLDGGSGCIDADGGASCAAAGGATSYLRNDSYGDSCDTCSGPGSVDTDGDGRCNEFDNCPSIANPDQQDGNSDRIGDACSPRVVISSITSGAMSNLEVDASVSSPVNLSLSGSVKVNDCTSNAVTQLSYTWLASSCSLPQSTFELTINGVTIASVPPDPSGASCTCTPGVSSYTVPIGGALPLLRAGVNQLGVRKTGTSSTHLAWAYATLTVDGLPQQVQIFDYNGGSNYGNPDLCLSGHTTAAVDSQATTSIAGATQLSQPWSGSLPCSLDISGLAPSACYTLVVTATDGVVGSPSTAYREFALNTETTLVRVDGNGCDDGVFCNGADTCTAGTCAHAGNPCSSGADCNNTCNETADNCFTPATTVCNDEPNPCTVDQCDGAGICAHSAGNAGAICRPVAGLCDVSESCSGSSATCPADEVVGSGTECRASTGVCDPAEACDGTSPACPADAKSTALCRASAGNCDVAEFCDGTHGNCPGDAKRPNGFSCNDGDGCPADTCQSGICQAVTCPNVDTMVLAGKPINVTIPNGKTSVLKNISISVRNADSIDRVISLMIDGSGCPIGTAGTPDFITSTPVADNSILVPAGKTKKAKLPLAIDSAAFNSFNFKAPVRCVLVVSASALISGGSNDPMPENNVAVLELNIVDKNDPQQSGTHESIVKSAKPTTLKIASGKISAVRTLKVALGNADYQPTAESPGDPISLIAQTTCPGLTLSAPVCDPTTMSNEVTVAGGRTKTCKLTASADGAQIHTSNHRSPRRCTVTLAAFGPSNPQTAPLDGSNNTTEMTIDISDNND